METGRATMFLCLVLASAAIADARALGRQAPKQISPSLKEDPHWVQQGPAWKAKEAEKVVEKTKDPNQVSPPLEHPASSKDLLKDKKPKVDVLHFGHPYPAPQDNSEFNHDFVHDSNSDDGSFAAQQEYDLLRHKLRQQKQAVADALKKQQEEQKELVETNKNYQEAIAKERAEIASKQAVIAEKVHDAEMADKKYADAAAKALKEKEQLAKEMKEKREAIKDAHKIQKKEDPHWVHKGPEYGEAKEAAEKKEPHWVHKGPEYSAEGTVEKPKEHGSTSKPWSIWDLLPWANKKADEAQKAVKVAKKEAHWVHEGPGYPLDAQVGAATKDVAQSLKSLEQCQKELSDAQAELRSMMEKLDAAKSKQLKARLASVQAMKKQEAAEHVELGVHKIYAKEAKEHEIAEAAFLKQQALVEKLKRQLEDASARVKSYRDAEDKSGGVYNTPTKSIASVIAGPGLLAFALAAAASL